MHAKTSWHRHSLQSSDRTTGEESKYAASGGVLLTASEPPAIGFAEEYLQYNRTALSHVSWTEVCLLHICTLENAMEYK